MSSTASWNSACTIAAATAVAAAAVYLLSTSRRKEVIEVSEAKSPSSVNAVSTKVVSKHIDERIRSVVLPSVLRSMPAEWRGTTFNNSELLGRAGFTKKLDALLLRHAESGSGEVSASELTDLGMAEDYLRVSSNSSTTLEALLARVSYGRADVSNVFSFSSPLTPIVAVMFSTQCKVVHIYGPTPAEWTPERRKLLARICCIEIVCQPTANLPTVHKPGVIVLRILPERSPTAALAGGMGCADALIDGSTLLILDSGHVPPESIMLFRKRLATPATTPMALAALQRLAGVAVTYDTERASTAAIDEACAHLQALSGSVDRPETKPLMFAAGLPALASMWVTLMDNGGVDVVMCSTAYGGSSQVTDVLSARSGGTLLRKHTFDIQGAADIVVNIRGALDRLARSATSGGGALLGTTCLFVEIPTNPDMKVPDLKLVVDALTAYKAQAHGAKVMIMVDTTFAPCSKVLARLQALDSDLMAFAFVSLSKAFSRGCTTAGALVPNGTATAMALHAKIADNAAVLGTTATPDQLHALATQHTGVEVRCADAHKVATAVGKALCEAVGKHVKSHGVAAGMQISFVSPSHAKIGFTAPTFSFNLPSPISASSDERAALAQRFVDLLCTRKTLFKPCVSFGQDNGLVYCTVPATSTQGALKAEDKARQAQGGVQLVRLSFPPTIDVAAVNAVIAEAVSNVYS